METKQFIAKKTILILGAGFMQIPAIQAAKELGLKVFACDGNPRAVAIPLLDGFASIDLKDTQALVDFALSLKKTQGLAAVFTAATDFSASVAKIAEACALKGHSYEAALNASDKIRMRSCFRKNAVSSPLFVEIDAQRFQKNPLEIKASLIFDYPFVVKPVDNMGSRGCQMVRNEAEFDKALNEAFLYSKSGRVIVEEYMKGDEYSIDALVYNGEVFITGFADRHIFFQPFFVEMGHTMPTKLSIEVQNEIISVFTKGIKALGLSHGAAKGDIKLTKDGVKIGEIAARLSGGYMSGWTYPYASGIELTKLAIRLALGDKLNFEEIKNSFEPQNHSAERAWISIPGTLKNIHGIEIAEKVAGVKDVFPRSKIGDKLVFPKNNVEKAGNVLSQANSREKAIIASEKAVSQIFLELEPNKPETDAFIAEDFLTSFPPSAYAILGKEGEAFLEKQKNEKAIEIFTFFEKINLDRLEAFIETEFSTQAKLLKDWNSKLFAEALRELAFFIKNDIGLKEKKLPAYDFWKAFLRGGSQALLYIIKTKAK